MSRLKDFKSKLESEKKELQVIIIDSKTGELIKEIDYLTQDEIQEIINKEQNNESNEVQPDLSNNVFNKWKNFN